MIDSKQKWEQVPNLNKFVKKYLSTSRKALELIENQCKEVEQFLETSGKPMLDEKFHLLVSRAASSLEPFLETRDIEGKSDSNLSKLVSRIRTLFIPIITSRIEILKQMKRAINKNNIEQLNTLWNQLKDSRESEKAYMPLVMSATKFRAELTKISIDDSGSIPEDVMKARKKEYEYAMRAADLAAEAMAD